MSMRLRQGFGMLAALAVLMALPLMVLGGLLWIDADPATRTLLSGMLRPRGALLVFAFVLVFALCAVWVWRRASHHRRRIARIDDAMRLMLGPQPQARRVTDDDLGSLASLAHGINALADERDALQRDVEARVADGARSLEAERNRLAALMAELAQSVVVCNLDGRILLYNQRARRLFQQWSRAPEIAGGGELIGLGRSIHAVLGRERIEHALQRLTAGEHESERMAGFVASCGERLVRVRMAPVPGDVSEAASGNGALAGFILMLDDVTESHAAEVQRDRLLLSLTERYRGALANLLTAAEMLDYQDVEAGLRERLLDVVLSEARSMRETLDDTARAFVDSLRSRWPLEDMRGEDLVAVLCVRLSEAPGLEIREADVERGVWLRVDSFSLLQSWRLLSQRLRDECGLVALELELQATDGHAYLDLAWRSQRETFECARNALGAWEQEPLSESGMMSPLCVRDVVERHSGELWVQRGNELDQRDRLRFLLPKADPIAGQVQPATLSPSDARPEFYDFDLFSWSDHADGLEDARLAELAYTAFDTETTGLYPSEGDEIIEIGAVRIINGKLLRGECFEQLIDPRRALRPEAVQVHGITAERLAGQPGIETVLPAFHAFAADTVLIAHNAAFDMRFLQLKEDVTGLCFEQPVLDTLLLSAVLHPDEASHRIDAIAARLGVTVEGRHTALGDAVLAAVVFLRMIPLLEARGICSLRDAREASRRTWLARLRY